MAHDTPRGIPGIEGKEPVGVVLTMGIKTQRGPVEKDRLHLVSPVANASDVRDPHPMFAPFNNAAPGARQVVYGTLAHNRPEECFSYNYRAQKTPSPPAHPQRRPFCSGNGTKAKRWTGGAPDDYTDIVCPGEKCEFRQGDRALCRPWMRFLFRLQWLKPDTVMPTPLAKFTSQGWGTISNFVGFFKHIEEAAHGLGLQGYSLMGFPIQLMMAEKTNRERKSRFPVLTIAALGDPAAFFRQQMDDRQKYLEAPRIVSLLDAGSEGSDIIDADDFLAHQPGVASEPRRLHTED